MKADGLLEMVYYSTPFFSNGTITSCTTRFLLSEL